MFIVYLSILYLSIYLFTSVFTWPVISLFVSILYPSIYLPIYLCVYLCVYRPSIICLPVHLYVAYLFTWVWVCVFPDQSNINLPVYLYVYLFTGISLFVRFQTRPSSAWQDVGRVSMRIRWVRAVQCSYPAPTTRAPPPGPTGEHAGQVKVELRLGRGEEFLSVIRISEVLSV